MGNQIVILALIQALQKEVLLLEQELAQQSTQTAVVQYIPPPSLVGIGGPDLGSNPQPVNPDEVLTSVQLSGAPADNANNVFYTGNDEGNLCITLFDSNGNLITDASATIYTDTVSGQYNEGDQLIPVSFDLPQADTPDCSYLVTNPNGGHSFMSGMGYSFQYVPPSDGTHYIGVTALGSSTSITVTSIDPPAGFVGAGLYSWAQR